MSRLVIRGRNRLLGEVTVGGSKNSSVAVVPAALLADGKCVIDNLPMIRDVRVFAQILSDLGASVSIEGNSMAIAPNGFSSHVAPYDLVKKLRASYYLMGVLLAKFGRAEVGLPGGCDIGPRPIDQHLKGFRALGAEATVEGGVVRLHAKKLVGAPIYLDIPSVGATINIMLAASRAEGTTIIENAAKEPHVVDLANFLNAMGARVLGAGTDVVRVRGVSKMNAANHSVIPDDMEAATFMMAAVATSGDVVVRNVITKHLEPITAKLKEAGAVITENGDYVRVQGPERPHPINVKTLPYPGFPTDAQQPLVSVLARADGVSVVQESMYDNRFGHVNELVRMGANIKVEGRTAIVEGVPKLVGAPVKVSDLRAGASLIIAGLSAHGVTEVNGMEIVQRGYEMMPEKLRSLGADVTEEDE
ncbi:MAG TPA: UDP-N-acetylglucosamine 1-carboxyvinyltransferase [Firmicutes bacterium]|nr:UDP-N-acetylglucosamine 1-carboxyvinyltransferase [Candidatus Fermentithermobacillaceae bacterium]